MASNFQIYSYKTRDSLHLKLNGDFDGSSAHELINILNEAGSSYCETMDGPDTLSAGVFLTVADQHRIG